jgi:hypothetical protein
MPMYFFTVEDHVKLVAEEGENLPDDAAARTHAAAVAADLGRNNSSGFDIVAVDEKGVEVARVTILGE